MTKKAEDLQRRIRETQEKAEKYARENSIHTHTSEFRGCKKCGSKLATKYIKGENCPLCGNDVIKNRYAYGCRDYQNCKFKVSTQICGRWISKSNVEKLLSEGVTSNIEGFVSQNGKNFNARLKLDSENKVVFDFIN